MMTSHDYKSGRLISRQPRTIWGWFKLTAYRKPYIASRMIT